MNRKSKNRSAKIASFFRSHAKLSFGKTPVLLLLLLYRLCIGIERCKILERCVMTLSHASYEKWGERGLRSTDIGFT